MSDTNNFILVGAGVESRVVGTLLALMDGIDNSAFQESTLSPDKSTSSAKSTTTKPQGSVVVIATSNRPQHIDDAIRRPGRIDREIEVAYSRCRLRC